MAEAARPHRKKRKIPRHIDHFASIFDQAETLNAQEDVINKPDRRFVGVKFSAVKSERTCPKDLISNLGPRLTLPLHAKRTHQVHEPIIEEDFICKSEEVKNLNTMLLRTGTQVNIDP